MTFGFLQTVTLLFGNQLDVQTSDTALLKVTYLMLILDLPDVHDEPPSHLHLWVLVFLSYYPSCVFFHSLQVCEGHVGLVGKRI